MPKPTLSEDTKRVLCYVCKKTIYLNSRGGVGEGGKWFHYACYNATNCKQEDSVGKPETTDYKEFINSPDAVFAHIKGRNYIQVDNKIRRIDKIIDSEITRARKEERTSIIIDLDNMRKHPMLANLIKQNREKIGLTQKEFGRMYGVTQVSLHYWETGKREPCYKILFDLLED